MRNPDPREQKLPQWVQETLTGLRREVASLERDLANTRARAEDARLATGPQDAKIYFYPEGADEPTGLPETEMIFRMEDARAEISIVHDIDGRRLVICAEPSGMLYVWPMDRDCIQVGLGE